MTKGAFRIPVYGGSDPDPATYCPANGYILNPINPDDGWNLLAEFDTNSPSSTTFDPKIIADTGEYAWDLGDGTIIKYQKEISYTYLSSATKTVKLYGKGTCNIRQIWLDGDNIVGTLDLSNDVFKPLTDINLYTNSLLTSVVFPAVTTGTINQINIYSTGISGTLDLSMFNTFTSSGTASIWLHSNPSMTGITWASSITGSIASLQIYSTGISGTLDLSKFSTFSSNAGIYLYSNPSITGINWASSITGTFSNLQIYSTGISGTLDLSKFSSFSTSAFIYLYSNPSMTGITWASSITGTIRYLLIYSTGISGTLDLSKLSSFTSTAYIDIHSNSSMTGITWASSITGTFSFLYLYSLNVTTLDISKFTSFTSTATVHIYSNTSLTSITLPSSPITGIIKTLRMTGNTSLGYFDTTKFNSTAVASLDWQLQNNGWDTATVNHILVDIDSISGSGFTGRIINIGGSNADPDGTSGGYDGTTARNQLITDGFTVTII